MFDRMLPPKNPNEEKKHLQQHQAMMKKARKLGMRITQLMGWMDPKRFHIHRGQKGEGSDSSQRGKGQDDGASNSCMGK